MVAFTTIARVELQTTRLHQLRAMARRAALAVKDAALSTDPQELHDAAVSAVAVLRLVMEETR